MFKIETSQILKGKLKIPYVRFNFYKGKPKHILCKSYSKNYQTGLYEFEFESEPILNPTIKISKVKSVEELPEPPDLEGVLVD